MKKISIDNVEYIDGQKFLLMFRDDKQQTIDFSDFFEKLIQFHQPF